MTQKKTILSGIQPSGRLHIGNYFGAMRQHIKMQDEGEAFYFLANYHALTSLSSGKQLREFTKDVVLDYLALGLDPEKCTLFAQSDVPQVTELAWILGCTTPVSLMEQGVADKDKVANGLNPNIGLFTYPILQAADILIYHSDLVPVGQDQKQNIEIARDLAGKLNRMLDQELHKRPEVALVRCVAVGQDEKQNIERARDLAGKLNRMLEQELLKLPEVYIVKSVATVPGTDGRKMSKSYDNAIHIFDEGNVLKKKVMSIQTDSAGLDDPKDPDTCNVFALISLFAEEEKRLEIAEKYRAGGYGYGHAKKELLELINAYFAEARERRKELEKDLQYVRDVLYEGGLRARKRAEEVMEPIRSATGLYRSFQYSF